MRETLDFLMERAGHDVGLDDAEIADLQAPAERHQYNLGNGAVGARTIHRGVPFEGPGVYEMASQGGCRVEIFADGEHPNVVEATDHSDALAMNQTLKNILGGLPLGGAKADIFVPLSIFKNPERFHAVLGSFVRHHAGLIRHGDGIGPDMNLVSADMDYMADTLVGISHNPRDVSRFTGKSITHYGVPGREDATSHGMRSAVKLFSAAEGWSLDGATVAIEGSGNVGYHFARLAYEAGARVMGMSDKNQAVAAHNLRGHGLIPDTDIKFAGTDIASFNQDLAFSRGRSVDLHQLDVDLFVFAGPSGSVTIQKKNVGDVAAPRLHCGANTPMDQAAIEYAERLGKTIYPDIAVNFGGVVGSYVERTSGGLATEDDVYGEIDRRIAHAVEMILFESIDPSGYLRKANELAIRQLYQRDHVLAA